MNELDIAVLIFIAYEIGVGESAVELIGRYGDHEARIPPEAMDHPGAFPIDGNHTGWKN